MTQAQPFSLEISGLDNLRKEMETWEKQDAAKYEKGLKRFLQLCVNEIKRLCPRGITKGAGLMGSIKYDIIKTFVQGLLIDGEVYSDCPYSKYVVLGTKPHMPPTGIDNNDGIYLWVKRKLRKKGKEAEEIAWAIAMTIKKYGSKARPFMQEGITNMAPKFESVMIEAFNE